MIKEIARAKSPSILKPTKLFYFCSALHCEEKSRALMLLNTIASTYMRVREKDWDSRVTHAWAFWLKAKEGSMQHRGGCH